MKQAIRIHDIDFPLELRKSGILIQQTASDESRLLAHRVAVAEEVVAEGDEVGFEVEPVEGSGRDAVKGEFAEFLAEAAAGIEEGLVVVDEAGEDAGVEGVFLEGEVEEAELADAGVGPGAEGAVTLCIR